MECTKKEEVLMYFKIQTHFCFKVEDIDFVVLSHAHIDHSGRMPKLYKEGYRNPVYATKGDM